MKEYHILYVKLLFFGQTQKIVPVAKHWTGYASDSNNFI